MKKKDKEFGSKVNLVDNMGKNEDSEPQEKQKDLEGQGIKLPKRAAFNRQGSVEERVLTPDEKSFLLCVERGDVSSAKRIIMAMKKRPTVFDVNCVDPLGRSALIIAVENENADMIDMLLEAEIKSKDALLVAIREDYVDGVEILLKHEEDTHREGQPYSWESMENSVANFTSDITPLILAAHRNNYEILKMLLDRGATIPIPHDVKCSCEECILGSSDDSLKFSLARINAYRALSSPSLISLSSRDPILTAFQLSDELKRLATAEAQFKEEYNNLRKQVQDFVTGLIDQARTSYELEVILNHNPCGEPWQIGDFQTLERLKLAIQYKQKAFVAHPSVQQLLASIWYEGLPGFRRKHVFRQIIDVLKLACTFPLNSFVYILAPHSQNGQFMRNPFVKFISHSSSYLFFLFLLALASQRIEHILISVICFLFPGTEWLAEIKKNWIKYERGSLPHIVEMLIIIWIQGLVWVEIKAFWKDGLLGYLKDLWNLADIFSYGSFLTWIGLRAVAWLLVQKEQWEGVDPELIWTPKETWHPFEPQLLAEAMFGAGMIGSYLKLVYILSINPYLGPLQIALGKMVIDIIKWLFLYLLVVFAFGCGMNQLLWYYSDLERQQCYSLPGGEQNLEERDSCLTWRRFANLWETSQSLFWASFGLVDLGDFELTGIKEFTRFWGLLMFGSYSVCNIIVLLNMLIAMMSNSYQLIHERSDTEWKFSRSKLWISYFNPGGTVPAPFNLIPTPKSIIRILTCRKAKEKTYTQEDMEAANERYFSVMKFVIRRYVTSEQRKSEDYSITEDDIQEVRQDINSFKYELMDILRNNKMNVPNHKREDGVLGRKSKNMERQIQKGFNINHIEGVMQAFVNASQEAEKPKDVFKRFAKILGDKDRERRREEEGKRRSSMKRDPIGSTNASIRRHKNSLKRSLLERGNSQAEIKMVLTKLNSEELVAFNPHLSEYAPTVRMAYAKFKTSLDNYHEKFGATKLVETVDTKKEILRNRESIRKLIIESAKLFDSGSMSTEINKTVASLEKIIDNDPRNSEEEKKEKSKVEEAMNNQMSSGEGKVNEGFVDDESNSNEMSPPKNITADKTPLQPQELSKNLSIRESSSKVDAGSPSKPNTKERTDVTSTQLAASVPASMPLDDPSLKEEKVTTPKKPSLAREKPNEESPAPSTSIVKTTEPVGKFDPEGKSAVSGQKRTGWI